MRQAREEGFEVPAAETEVKAFRRLQRLVQSFDGHGPRRRPLHLPGVIA